MTEKTVILSFRVPQSLKTKLETRAALERKTLTEFVRDTLSRSQGEKVLESARQEFTALESDAAAMNDHINALKVKYGEMMETVAQSQSGLLDEMESRRKRLKRDRTIDSLLMGMFCLGGSLLGTMALWAIQVLGK